MKRIILLIALFATTEFLHAQTAIPAHFVDNWISTLNKHDTLSLQQFYSDTVTLVSSNWEGEKKGKNELRNVYHRYFSGTPDLSFAISNVVSTLNTIVLEYSYAGTFSNPEAGTPGYMKNKHYVLKMITRFEFANGKIVYQVSYFDQVAFLRQVGFFDQKQ